MTTPTTTAHTGKPNSVYIESKQLLPGLLPQITAGDVVRLTVRQNSQNGQGQIYFRGQLMSANIPPELAVGDKLLAKIMLGQDQLLFQILDHQRANQAQGQMGLGALEARLQALLQELPTPAIRGSQTIALPPSLQNLKLDQNLLQSLFSHISTAEQLQDPAVLAQQLKAASNPAMPQTLREAAETIRSFVQQHTLPQNQGLFEALKHELFQMLERSSLDNQLAARQLYNMISVLKDEATTAKAQGRTDTKLLESAFKELSAAQQHPEKQAELLTETLRQLSQHTITASRNTPTPQALQDLQQLATRLEQLANTLDSLTRLNPVMQAMGEPALILFPFLFQGLISHSEVTVETKQPKRKKKGDEDSAEEDGEGSSRDGQSSTSFQRIQVTVPLPAFGSVDIDIAYRKEEILVRFNTDENEKAEFLLEQLEQLGAILREQGFKRTELIATVGRKRDSMATWTMGMSSLGSRIA